MPGIGIGVSPVLRRNDLPSLKSYTSQMSFWANGLESDGLTLTSPVGSGGALKELSCLRLINTYLQAPSMNTLDESATYKFTFVFQLPSFPTAGAYILLAPQSKGIILQLYNTITPGGWYIKINDSTTGVYNIDGRSLDWLTIGVNVIEITINCATKAVAVKINGNTGNYTHNVSNLVSGVNYYRIGATNMSVDPIYFRLDKNGVAQHEYIFSYRTLGVGSIEGTTYQFDDLITDTNAMQIYPSANTKVFTTQSGYNPFRNGYKVMWNQGGLDYLKVHPISSNGTWKNRENYQILHTVEAGKIGYHVCEYIEMPNEAIFDTTNRTYWKSSITSDPYYVGGTAGKERYFHRTWLDWSWIDQHIETAYKGQVYIRLKKKHVASQEPVIVEINDIVRFSAAVPAYSVRRDIDTDTALGNFFMSRIAEYKQMRDATGEYLLLAMKGDKRVMQIGDHLCYSSDRGNTFNTGIAVNTINTLATYPFSCVRILESGNIVIFTQHKEAYYSDDNLTTVKPCTVLDKDGNTFTFHTPVNASYPGGYFLDFHNFIEDGGLLIYGNYANSTTGCAPSNMFYSLDDGATWKVFYAFGQNQYYTDNGSANGAPGGNVLGDATNPIVCRHIHGINKGFDGNYYACTGDGNNTYPEMHFMKLVYDADTDAWTVTIINDQTSAMWQRMRAIGIYERNGYIYWASDGMLPDVVDGVTYPQHGILRCKIEDINDITKHELIHDLPDEAYYFARGKGNIVFCGMDTGNTTFYVSRDGGDTWETETIIFHDNAIRPAYYDSDSNKIVVLSRYTIESV